MSPRSAKIVSMASNMGPSPTRTKQRFSSPATNLRDGVRKGRFSPRPEPADVADDEFALRDAGASSKRCALTAGEGFESTPVGIVLSATAPGARRGDCGCCGSRRSPSRRDWRSPVASAMMKRPMTGAVARDVMAVGFPHRVIGEDEREISADYDAKCGIAHEEGRVGVDDLGCEVGELGGEQAGDGDADGHVAAVEVLDRRDPDETGFVLVGILVAA